MMNRFVETERKFSMEKIIHKSQVMIVPRRNESLQIKLGNRGLKLIILERCRCVNVK